MKNYQIINLLLFFRQIYKITFDIFFIQNICLIKKIMHKILKKYIKLLKNNDLKKIHKVSNYY